MQQGIKRDRVVPGDRMRKIDPRSFIQKKMAREEKDKRQLEEGCAVVDKGVAKE